MHEPNTTAHRPIVVDCPPFNDDNGGAIALHTLVDQLRSLGVEAYAVNLKHDYADIPSPLLRMLKRWNRRRRQGPFKSHPSMDVPLATKEIIENAIIVYPETRSGNPLQSPRVVRWLLHKPGFFGGDAKIGLNEEIFYYTSAYVEGLTGIPDNRDLTVGFFNERFYKNLGLPRHGSCRMIRKGKYNEHLIQKNYDSVLLDGKSHEEISYIFNTTDIFYCEDPYTAYLYFASLCGCVPVVVPQLGLSSEDWRAGIDLKHGVAYGEAEIEWARNTSHHIKSNMIATQERNKDSVLRFVHTIRKLFD